MSTKNLARTIIEGGRSSYNKRERRASHATERVLTRVYLARASQHEHGFERLVIGTRPKVYKDFADKLSPPRRWLRSQAGRPWSTVRSELFERFDPRNLAGQHIIFDHMLQEVDTGEELARFHTHQRFFVDDYGILRESTRPRRKRPKEPRKVWRSKAELEGWARGRRVGSSGGALYWHQPASHCAGCRGHSCCCCPHEDGRVKHGPHDHYRQHHCLTAEEIVFWNSLFTSDQARYRCRESHTS